MEFSQIPSASNSTPRYGLSRIQKAYHARIAYCYSIPGSERHEGSVKVGMSTVNINGSISEADLVEAVKKAAHARIRDQFKSASGMIAVITYKLEWSSILIRDNLQDHQIHMHLVDSGVVRRTDLNGAREWFICTPEYAFQALVSLEKRLPIMAEDKYAVVDFRKEQNQAISNTIAAFQAGDKKRLWNAKPRFGKTLTALETVRQLHELAKSDPTSPAVNRVLILTHRPVVNSAWATEFTQLFSSLGLEGTWLYGSKEKNHLSLPELLASGLPFIYFVSMQDSRGKINNEFKASNKDLFETDWDFGIIDESHEGNSTDLANEVHSKIRSNFTLYLSGTPFKDLASRTFGDKVDTWDYIDEQKAKEDWYTEEANLKEQLALLEDKVSALRGNTSVNDTLQQANTPAQIEALEAEIKLLLDSDHLKKPNPYAGLPKLWIHALDLNKSLGSNYQEVAEIGSFNFAELFAHHEVILDGKTIRQFRHDADVDAFLDNLTEESSSDFKDEDGENVYMPYAIDNPRDNNHALWVLPPDVKAAKLLSDKLYIHPYFKDYTILNVAGQEAGKNPLAKVLAGIGNEPYKTKTITLTVGRLTTGVTVGPWATVIMANNMSSPEQYMQTIFRVQSPFSYSNGLMKTDAFVYDLSPDRTLTIISQVNDVSTRAGITNSGSSIAKLDELLNYMPILSTSLNGKFKKLSAGEIVSSIKRIYKEKVLSSGFDTPVLFTIELENLSEEARLAIEEVRQVSGKSAPTTREKAMEVVIASNGLDNFKYKKDSEDSLKKEIAETEKIPAKELSPEEKEALKQRKEELERRGNMRNILRTISVRIPFMILALMNSPMFHNQMDRLKKEFSLEEFVAAFDTESWREFFGPISKETFLRLSPCFDMEILRIAIGAWIEIIESVLVERDKFEKERSSGNFLTALKHIQNFEKGIQDIMSKIKNPNKETVFTPYPVVALQYEAAGFGKTITIEGKEVKTFYDINVKSGLYPVYAAINIAKANPELSWDEICNTLIYANSRTLAGKWATATLLGQPNDWANITTVDVYEELNSEDLVLAKLKEEEKQAFVGHFLLSSLALKSGLNLSISDITLESHREAVIEIIKQRRVEMKDENSSDSSPEREKLNQELGLRFDFVISNPPYQIVINEKNGAAKPIWQNFLVIASQIGIKITMINPARWQKGGAGTGLLGVKKWLMSNKHFEKVINMPSDEIFPTADIRGGISIEVIDNARTFVNPKIGAWDKAGGWSKKEDFILTEDIDIPLSERDKSIISKIVAANIGANFEKELWIGGRGQTTKKQTSVPMGNGSNDIALMGPRLYRDTDYFITEAEKTAGVDYVKVWYREKSGNVLSARYLPYNEFQDTSNNNTRIPKWKSMISKTDAHYLYRNLGPIGEPNTLSTDTWLCRNFDTKQEVEGFNSYVQTYFYRYLLSLRIVSHIAYANIHRFVPDLKEVKNPRTGKIGYQSDWTDDDLVELFKDSLTHDDWRHIKKTAVIADKGRGDYEAGWIFPDGYSHKSLTKVDCTEVMKEVHEEYRRNPVAEEILEEVEEVEYSNGAK